MTDFRPANILTRITNLDHLSEEELLDLVGRPQQTDVITPSGEKHDLPTAPQYLVYPIIWQDVAQKPSAHDLITDKACIIDFGESYEVSDPPPEIGIPQIYCPPEYTLEKKVGVGCDIWALACTLFEIRTGQRLFDTFDDDPNECLWKIAMVLGKYPEPWWSETWKARRSYFQDDVDAEGRVVGVVKKKKDKGTNVWQRPWPRSLQDSIREGLYYEFSHRPGGVAKVIPEAEVEELAGLLGLLLRYAPEDRLSAQDALDHAWLTAVA